jgi:hypothetical protein
VPGHRADAEANLLGDLDDTDALGQLGSCLPQLVWLSTATPLIMLDLI